MGFFLTNVAKVFLTLPLNLLVGPLKVIYIIIYNIIEIHPVVFPGHKWVNYLLQSSSLSSQTL